MKKIFHQAKSALHKDGAGTGAPGQQPLTSDQPSTIQPPSPQDVLRYRYQHGTNLGSVFVLEKWLTGHMYPDDAPSAELAAVTGNIKQMGLDATRQKFEQHWREYVSDGDLDWLQNEAHCMRYPSYELYSRLRLTDTFQATPFDYQSDTSHSVQLIVRTHRSLTQQRCTRTRGRQ